MTTLRRPDGNRIAGRGRGSSFDESTRIAAPRGRGHRYVELRSTPRALGGSSEADYVETVCREVAGLRGDGPATTARLLVSVDRSRAGR